jgi:hypothetical protein
MKIKEERKIKSKGINDKEVVEGASCRNLSLGLVTKAKTCKGASQK